VGFAASFFQRYHFGSRRFDITLVLLDDRPHLNRRRIVAALEQLRICEVGFSKRLGLRVNQHALDGRVNCRAWYAAPESG
jgi:hypothetical protein